MELFSEFIIERNSRYGVFSRFFTFSDQDIEEIKSFCNLDCTYFHLIGLLILNKLENFSIKKISWGKDGDMIQVNFDDFENLQESTAGFGKDRNDAMNDFIKNLNGPFYQ